jgi:hypothetical protein
MVSTSSKTLPFIALALGAALALASIFGYAEQADKAIAALQALLPILGITAGGGLINKAIEKRDALLKGGNLDSVRAIVAEEIQKAKDEGKNETSPSQ